jgi:hypothetical protein
MTIRAEQLERRANKRFQAPMGAFAVLGPDATKVGRIIDISMNGLAFRHVDRKEPLHGLYELDLFMIDHDFHLNKIPFETISDYEIVNEAPFSFMTTRQTGLQFGELTPKQRSGLAHFIENHTLGEV